MGRYADFVFEFSVEWKFKGKPHSAILVLSQLQVHTHIRNVFPLRCRQTRFGVVEPDVSVPIWPSLFAWR